MLLPQTSPHYQSHLPLRARIALARVKALCLSQCQEHSRIVHFCCKRTLQSSQWRWANQDFQCRKKSDCGAKQMRFAHAVLPSNKCGTCSHTAVLTNNFEQTRTVDSNGNYNFVLLKGSIQNQASLNTVNASASSPLFGRPDFEDAEEKKRQKLERPKKENIIKARNRKGEYTIHDEQSMPQCKEVIEPMNEEEKESLRRQRISKANSGKVPWNKGGKHSLETKHRIREKVLERMKDPKIREKLRLQAQDATLSPEVRLKIKSGLLKAWNEKRKITARQDRCLKEWQEMVAETARVGCEGDVVYHWDSYSTIKKKLQLVWKSHVKKQRVSAFKPKRSMEHRMKISSAIKAKWSDPKYRIKVQNGIKEFMMNRGMPSHPLMAKQNGKAGSAARETVDGHLVRHPNAENELIMSEQAGVFIDAADGPKRSRKAKLLEPVVMKQTLDLSPYKDPETERKLEKLMSVRVRRMYAEAQKRKDITERARALILEAGEAARALEAAAVKDKNALAPLLETRRLLAEAVSSLESMNEKKVREESIEGGSCPYADVLGLANANFKWKDEVENPLEWESKHVNNSTSVENLTFTHAELNEK